MPDDWIIPAEGRAVVSTGSPGNEVYIESIIYVHSCTLLADNSVKCWGDNWRGHLGTVDFQSGTTPRNVQGLADGATILSAVGWHTCALSGGIVRCWGNNSHDQSGDVTYDGIFSPEKVFWD